MSWHWYLIIFCVLIVMYDYASFPWKPDPPDPSAPPKKWRNPDTLPKKRKWWP